MLNRIANNVYFSDNVVETDRPCLGYINGKDKSIMIDAGNSPAHVAQFIGELEALGLRYPDYVFITHHHWDHTYGMASLENAMTIAGTKTNDILREQKNYIWDMKHFEEYISDNRIPLFCKEHMLIEYPELKGIDVQEADLVFDGTMSIDLGGETVHMQHLSSAHTDECYILWCENDKILFLGDAFYEEVVGIDWIDHKDKVAAEIEQLKVIPFEKAVIGHDPVHTKEELLNVLEERLK